MASKKTTNPIFGATYEQSEQQKKPTILQFVKTLSRNITSFDSIVQVIWLPGTFNNYTLECVDFRVSVSPNNCLYIPISTGINTLTQSNRTIVVSIQSKTPLSYRLLEDSNLTGSWHSIGTDSGYRFFPDNLAEDNEW